MARFRDRFFSPPVARAVTSPSAILVAGAGMAGGILVGLPVALAAGAGLVAYGARVLLAVPRRPASPRIDPGALREPWQGYVRAALAAEERYDRAVARTAGGPLHDRLAEIGTRVETAVHESWRIARHGHDIEGALATLDTADAHRELAQLTHGGRVPSPEQARTVEALQAQVASAARMGKVVTDARDRLRFLDARLDELVARAVELSVGTGDDAALTGLGADVDGLVGEMESLRLALAETNQAGQPGSGPAPR